MAMKIIGITGPTGAGKTTALRELEELGAAVIDADEVYHRLLREDRALRDRLEELFGPLRDADGEIDRKKLGGIVFSDPSKLEQLNTVAQRATADRIQSLMQAHEAGGGEVAAVDAIALLESPLAALCTATVAVLAPPETRVRRIMAREGIPEDYAWARVRAQKGDDFYRKGCTHVLVNDGEDPAAFAAQARTLFRDIIEPH